jgi:hypothetical protein
MAGRSFHSALRQFRVRGFAAVGIVAAIATAWWVKVEDARVPDTPPQIAFGDPVKAGRGVFTPQSLTIVNAAPSSAAASSASGRKLVLAGLLENVTGNSQLEILGPPDELPALSSGGVTFAPPKVYLDRDKALLWQLQPRIREAVSIVWDIPEDWREQEVTVEFSAQHFKIKDNLYAKASWLLFYPTGTLSARPEHGA